MGVVMTNQVKLPVGQSALRCHVWVPSVMESVYSLVDKQVWDIVFDTVEWRVQEALRRWLVQRRAATLG
jgi:hypothetical protein